MRESLPKMKTLSWWKCQNTLELSQKFLKTWTKNFYYVKWKTEEVKHNTSNEVNSHRWHSWLSSLNLDPKFQILLNLRQTSFNLYLKGINPDPPSRHVILLSIHYPSKIDILRQFTAAPFPSYRGSWLWHSKGGWRRGRYLRRSAVSVL